MCISAEINDTLLFRLLSIWRWISIIRSCTSYTCSSDKLRTSITGTTSNEEIPTAKYYDVTLHKRVSLISSFKMQLSMVNIEYNTKHKYKFSCGYLYRCHSGNHTYAYIHWNKGHAFVSVTEDFDVTSTKASSFISSFRYIWNEKYNFEPIYLYLQLWKENFNEKYS